MYTLGSLFDGSGGFPLAGTLCGIMPLWAAEVEPYPVAVTRGRFPSMRHLGDISKINGAEIEPVDIITFGSPCQDLSVAGKRAGLKHEDNGDEETTRSGLFMEAVRIIKEMRAATNGEYPSFALWENVPGAFSSNGGEDFRTVLTELIRITEPNAVMPPVPKAGWAYADSYAGDGWSIAYRVFDAQFWGVSQRRRRIHLVCDFRGGRAGEILFNREGVRGYFEACGTQRETIAGHAADSSGTDDSEGVRVYDARGNGNGQTVSTLTGDHQNRVTDYTSIVTMATQQGGAEIRTDDKCPTITAAAGMSGNNQPVVCTHAAGFKPGQGAKARGLGYESEISPTLPAGAEPGVVYCLQGNGIDRADTAGCNDKGWTDGAAYTLNTIDRSAVVFDVQRTGQYGENGVVSTQAARQYKDATDLVVEGETPRYIVRRLTPTECARLQGFPDRWGDIPHKDDLTPEELIFWRDVRNTHAVINGRAQKEYTAAQMLTWYNKLHTDSAEYKMWGNGIALPPALYCMQGIADALTAADDWIN